MQKMSIFNREKYVHASSHVFPSAGLALSLEPEVAGVWLNTAATALHKFVIAFSVGVELIANKVMMPI